MTVSRNRGDGGRRKRVRKANVRDPDGHPELQHVRLHVLGGENRIRVRPRNVPQLQPVLFAAGRNLVPTKKNFNGVPDGEDRHRQEGLELSREISEIKADVAKILCQFNFGYIFWHNDEFLQ